MASKGKKKSAQAEAESKAFAEHDAVMLMTAPEDIRFASTQNQTKYCWTLYNEYLRCGKAKGVLDPECQLIYDMSCSYCPRSWRDRWKEQRREGTFPGFQLEWDPAEEDEEDESPFGKAAEEEEASESEEESAGEEKEEPSEENAHKPEETEPDVNKETFIKAEDVPQQTSEKEKTARTKKSKKPKKVTEGPSDSGSESEPEEHAAAVSESESEPEPASESESEAEPPSPKKEKRKKKKKKHEEH